MTKIIFLDIDGVLNRQATKGFHPIERRQVDLLNKIISVTGAKVIISSSWREFGLSWITQSLKNAGFRGAVIGHTPFHLKHLENPTRGDEIEATLRTMPSMPSAICVLDNREDMGRFAPFLVKTDPLVGLVQEDVPKAIAVLNS